MAVDPDAANAPVGPPSLDEPLLRINSSGIQSAVTWVHNVVTSLAANIEAERGRQSLTETELRNEDSRLRECVERLEARLDSLSLSPIRRAKSSASIGADSSPSTTDVTSAVQEKDAVAELSSRLENAVGDIAVRLTSIEGGMGPIDGAAAKEYGLELKQHADRARHLEEQLENLRQQMAQRLSAQEELAAMRLETIERELLACVRPTDLDSLRSEITDCKARLQRDMPTEVRALGANLQKELLGRGDGLQKDFKAVSDAIDAKLQLFEEQMEVIAQCGGGNGAGGNSEEGAASAQIALATGKISREMVGLESRIRDVEGLRDQNFDGRISELERIVAAEGLGEQRIKERNLEFEGTELLDGVDLSASGDRGLSSTSRDLDLSQSAPSRQAEDVPENSQIVMLAEKVEKSLSDMSSRIAALEEGRLLTGGGGEQLVAEAAARAATVAAEAAAPPASLVTDFSKRLDSSLSDVSKRIASLEKQVGAIAELPMAAAVSGDALSAENSPQEAPLGDLAARVDAQLDGLQYKILALEQRMEQQSLTSPGLEQDGVSDVVSQRLVDVERRLEEMQAQMDSGVPSGASSNILEGLSHELESAKARIGLELGQDLDAKTAALREDVDAKTAAVERRLIELFDSRGPTSFEAVDSSTRELGLSDDTPPVSLEEFTALSEKVVAMEGKLERTISNVADVSAEAAAYAATQANDRLEQGQNERNQEVRMSSMWTELAGHAEAAAVRADALERSLMSRIEQIEVSVVDMLKNGLDSKKDQQKMDMTKSLEWLNWRISWLEWATNGEKRSFSRPVDAKGFLPSPPPQTIAATCFSQAISEDVELWTRDKITGQRRLRRELKSQPQSFADVTNGPNGPMRNSASASRLPRLTQ